MFKTKRDVDRHVSHILNRLRDEKERNSRGFQFAKLYYDVGDYESGKRYLQAFLSIREAVPQAHKLMGQIYEALRDKPHALESYKRTLDLDPEQKDIVLKVCELYGDTSVPINRDLAKEHYHQSVKLFESRSGPGSKLFAKFWIEIAEKYYPNNFSVYKLKERILYIDSRGDAAELEHLISSELVKNPQDVKLHVKLLNLHIQSRNVERAYEHAVQTEKTLAFVDNIDWYECLVDIYKVYQDQKSCSGDTEFFTYKLFALSNLASLRLKSGERDVVSCVKVIHQLDVGLQEVSQLTKQSAEWEDFLSEMSGQLFFLIGTLLLKRAAKGQVTWKEASSFCAICYLLSDSCTAVKLKTSWFKHLSADKKKFYERLYMTGCDRLSQGGHMIYSLLSKQDGSLWARKLRQNLCTKQGEESLFNLVFTGEDMKQKKDRSFLLKSNKFTGTILDTPSKGQLAEYDAVAYSLHCNDLNHLVWLALQHHSTKDNSQPDYEQLYGYQLFKNMKYSVPDLTNGDPGSLCQLDVQAFFYATVHWSALQKVERNRNLHPIPDKPDLLPVFLSQPLATQQQCDWWLAVYGLENKTTSEKFSKLWGVLMRGLETVRLILPHTIPLNIVIHVAQTLDERAKEMESLDVGGLVTAKLTGLQNRAGFYWKAASDLLERLDRGQPLKMPKDCLFSGDTMMDPALLKELKEKSKFALAVVAMREGRHEDALNSFEELYHPQAAYYTGLIYRNLAESVDTNSNSSTDKNSQQMALLTKSKNSLYQALDRTTSDRDQELKCAITRDLDDVVCKLISMESGGPLVDSILSANSQNYSTAESEVDSEEEKRNPSHQTTPILPKSLQVNKPIQPSPTRIEIQMKALETAYQSQTKRMTTLEDTIQKLFTEHQKLSTEFLIQLRESREENKFLREQLQLASLQGASMSLPRTPMPPFARTPQSRGALMNQINQSYQAPGQYPFPGQGPAVPNHMSQFGYSIGSPVRPGSAFGQDDIEDDYNNVDGEYFDPEEQGQFLVPDSSLVQDWPFGHKAGVEGKSTITYAPQMPSAKGMGQTDPGMFANALRGQSIQYGAYGQPQPAAPPVRPPMPGPGFFAQTQQPSQPGTAQGMGTMSGPSQQLGMMGLAGQSPAMSPGPPALSVAKPPVTSIMPPNAVASTSITTKPRLIPESVGVPSQKPGEKAAAQSTTLSQQQASQGIPANPTSQAQVTDTQNPVTSASILANLLTDPKLTSQSASYSPGSASSVLSSLAAKHQQETSQAQSSAPAPAAAQNTPQKTVFSGFSFTSTPKVVEPKAEEKPKQPVTTASEAKPFSGFSFSLPPKTPTTTSVSKTEPVTVPKQSVDTPSPFGLGQNTSSSFASLAAGGAKENAFRAAGDFKGFQGAGQALFGKSPSPKKGDKSLDDEHVDEYEPEVDFKPIVPLPALVTVKTGEEDEEKLFNERTKLFRFDTDVQQWKERGIGELKILKNKLSGKVRILMRREQVLKVCANHTIKSDMKLTPMSSSDKAWCWNAMDYADGEMKREQLAAKFKSAEIAAKFKEVFEQCQKDLSALEVKPTAKVSKPKEEVKAGKNELSALFKQEAGSWKCDGCLITNKAEILKCPCCGTLKPGVKAEDVKEEPSSSVFDKLGAKSSSSGFTFGSSSGGSSVQTGKGFVFGGQASSDTPSGSQSSGFKFGNQASTTTTTATKSGEQPSGGFKFITQAAADSTSDKATGVKFGTQPSETKDAKGTADSTLQKGTGFKFGTQPSDTKDAKDTANSALPKGTGFKIGAQSSEKAKEGSEVVFGGNKISDASKEATSAGFTIDQGSTKYPFGGEPKADVTKTAADDSEACQTKPNLLAHLLDNESRSGFKLGQSTGTSFTFGSPQTPASKEVPTKPSGFTFGDSATKTSGFTFGTPANKEGKPSSEASTGFNFSMSMTPKMPTSGRSPLKSPGVTSPKSPDGTDEGYYITQDGDDSHIYFEPIIALPEKVEVKTGEEEEEVLFSQRAKLFRFVNGEWKERGLGDIKVLYNDTEKKARVLMRREQILKICCNHYISKELTMKPMPSSKGRALIWYAMDFADGEQNAENFSARFKSEESAKDFETAIESAKARLYGEKSEVEQTPKTKEETSQEVETIGAVSSDDVQFIKEETASPGEIQEARKYLLPDHFYLYLRKAPCPGCIGCDSDNFCPDWEAREAVKDSDDVQNDDDEVDLDEEDEIDEDDDYEDEDYETEEDYEDENDDGPGIEEVLVKKDTGFGLGSQKPVEVETLGGAVFGSGASGFSFSSLAGAADPNAFKAADKPFTWQGAGKQVFGQGAGKQVFGQGDQAGSGEEDDGEGNVTQGDDPHFEPIVPLPDLVDVKTGEEDEIREFSYRAKLFRFDKDANQWKEKGLGEMKILRHKETGKCRLLLRREQVHKLACNHLLTADLVFRPLNTSETSWCWTAQDYSEGEPKIEQLAVKFKTIAIAAEFKSKLDEIQAEMKEPSATSSYEIHVMTGDISKAGTDANVYLVMYGSKGQTGELTLRESKTNKNKFERGKTDIFDIEASNIGQIEKIKIGHDGSGFGAGWFLDEVTIEVNSEEKYTFGCHRWLASDEGDKKLEVELEPSS